MDIEVTVTTAADLGERAEGYWKLFGYAPKTSIKGTFRAKNGDLVFLREYREMIGCGSVWMQVVADNEIVKVRPADETFSVFFQQSTERQLAEYRY